MSSLAVQNSILQYCAGHAVTSTGPYTGLSHALTSSLLITVYYDPTTELAKGESTIHKYSVILMNIAHVDDPGMA